MPAFNNHARKLPTRCWPSRRRYFCSRDRSLWCRVLPMKLPLNPPCG